jgi:hypothetical protein
MPNYKIVSSDVTFQLLDGEVVAIHFTKGIYYNLRGAAAVIFDALARGIESSQVVASFWGAPADAGSTIQLLADRFVADELLAVTGATSAPATQSTQVTAWKEPVVESYTDLQQLLLADPIHDVGTEAWPKLSEQPEASAAQT